MKQTFWHPFSDMSKLSDREVVLARGQGVWLRDTAGKAYLDATAGLWFANVGHGRDEIASAVAGQLRALAAYSTFDVFGNEPALELSDRLAALSPLPQTAVFLTSGGSDSVDTAAKMARRYWQLCGEPDRTLIIARSDAYHGMHGFGTSLAGISANAEGWGTIVGDVAHVDHSNIQALRAVFDKNKGRIAAFIGEPVIGAGGVRPPSPGYWQEVQKLCVEHEALLIVDEVVTGFGRLGDWFACQHYDIQPDLITTAKGITSGYLPLGAVLVGARVRDALWSEQAGVFRHGYTYSGHPACCAAALVNLDIIEREDLLNRVRDLTGVLAKHLDALQELPVVSQTRSAGLLGAVELSESVAGGRAKAVEDLVARMRGRGVLVRGLVGHSIQLSPPFVITEAELSQLFTVLSEELTEVPITGDERHPVDA